MRNSCRLGETHRVLVEVVNSEVAAQEDVSNDPELTTWHGDIETFKVTAINRDISAIR
jgi:hypothetical protein